MSVGGDGDGSERRRPSDRRQSDRRASARGTADRRRSDRRTRARVMLLAALTVGRGAASYAAIGPRPMLQRPYHGPRPYRPFIEKAALAHGVDAALVEAVIRVESAFNPHAVSLKGAQGLMQLMPDTAARFGVKNAFDPEQNIHGGTRYLAELLEQFGGDIALACAAYNAGEKVVLRYGGIPPYPETQLYVSKISRLLGHRGPLGPLVADAPSAPPLAPPRDDFFYTWKDARGILNVSQYPPPAGQVYEKHKLR
jgi:soluble lytic murein transglycosylase-like protein